MFSWGENEVQVDQRKLCSSGLSAHYYSWMLAKGPNEIPACAYCQEPLEDEKIDKLKLLRQRKGTVIPCCESSQSQPIAKKTPLTRPPLVSREAGKIFEPFSKGKSRNKKTPSCCSGKISKGRSS